MKKSIRLPSISFLNLGSALLNIGQETTIGAPLLHWPISKTPFLGHLGFDFLPSSATDSLLNQLKKLNMLLSVSSSLISSFIPERLKNI
jgi:hypothetical protein